jgi:DNA-binding response OmpR family regulator
VSQLLTAFGEALTLPLTLLIVDDETEVADTCARVLKRAGFDCVVAYDLQTAFELFDETQPALVLSDINLTNGDGYQIARYVRRRSPVTPVILMTAHHKNQVPDQAARAGASSYLRKPFSNAELTTAVKTLLETDSG